MTVRILSWARRHWVVLAVLALFVASDFKFRTRSTTASISGSIDGFIALELALYGLVGLYVLGRWVRPGRVLMAPEAIGACLYLLLMVLSIGYTPYPTFAVARVAEMLVLAGLALNIALTASRRDMHGMAHGFLVLVAVSVLYGAVVPSVPVSSLQAGRFTWLSIHPTVAGVFLSVATVLAFAYLGLQSPRPGPRWPWWAYAALLAVVGFGLIATRTRSAVVAAVLGVLACQWAYYRGRRRIEFISGTLVVGVLVLLTLLPEIETYLARGESVEQLQTLNSRTDLWSVAWSAILAEPVAGYGAGASQGIFQKAVGLGGGHNAAVNVAVDLGFAGLAAWLAFVVAIAVGIHRLPRTAADGFVLDRALLIALFLTIQVDGLFYAGPGGLANVGATWLFVTAAWVLVVRREAAVVRYSAAAPGGALS
jgi:O-antigen ligase